MAAKSPAKSARRYWRHTRTAFANVGFVAPYAQHFAGGALSVASAVSLPDRDEIWVAGCQYPPRVAANRIAIHFHPPFLLIQIAIKCMGLGSLDRQCSGFVVRGA